MSDANARIRFPNLNALRFFAAVAVILYHIEHKKHAYKLPSSFKNSYFLSTIGPPAVTFFFVLSGFLITYLLVKERDVYSSISIPRFYGRRVIRILPVYLVTVVTALFIAPHFKVFHVPKESETLAAHFWSIVCLCGTFLSNVAVAVYGNLPCVDQTWSVSVEEQFYLLWPLVLSFLPRRWFVAAMVAIAMLLPCVRYMVTPHTTVWILLLYNRFGCMALGGLGAMLVMDRPERLFRIITSRWTFITTLVLTFVVLCFPVYPQKWNLVQPECYSVLFCILIVNFACGSGVKIPLDGPFLRRAGDCSYSAYMYHNLIIAFACNTLLGKAWGGKHMAPAHLDLMLYPFVLGTTFLISWLSYILMEQPLLRLKSKLSPIQSSA
ncbi:MAG: acyltransferase 3 [Verrucomicrobiaceae bacterium]|nr:acyltransferase 3 [Verrucomicrobiaceae bacterium]